MAKKTVERLPSPTEIRDINKRREEIKRILQLSIEQDPRYAQYKRFVGAKIQFTVYRDKLTQVENRRFPEPKKGFELELAVSRAYEGAMRRYREYQAQLTKNRVLEDTEAIEKSLKEKVGLPQPLYFRLEPNSLIHGSYELKLYNLSEEPVVLERVLLAIKKALVNP